MQWTFKIFNYSYFPFLCISCTCFKILYRPILGMQVHSAFTFIWNITSFLNTSKSFDSAPDKHLLGNRH